MDSRDQVMGGREMSSARPQPGGRSLAVTRAAAVAITVGIGAASFVLSFAALHDLAARAGIPVQLAWLWPLIVDGTILQATMAVVALAGYREQDHSRRYFWVVLSSAAAVSLVANALHAVVAASAPLSPWLAAAIAVVAPIGLLATTHGLSLLIRVPGPIEAVRRRGENGGCPTVKRRPSDGVPAGPRGRRAGRALRAECARHRRRSATVGIGGRGHHVPIGHEGFRGLGGRQRAAPQLRAGVESPGDRQATRHRSAGGRRDRFSE